MTVAPTRLVNDDVEGVYHCIARCVRRAFLCGEDAFSGKNFDHRKIWVQNRLKELAGIFGIDIRGYAVMSNHLHVVPRNRPDLIGQWSDRETAERWWRLFPKRRDSHGHPEVATEMDLDQILDGEYRVVVLKSRLGSISWLMRCLDEHIARRANREDDCRGRFWEGRFKSVVLLDQAAILTCTAYVDLNPISHEQTCESNGPRQAGRQPGNLCIHFRSGSNSSQARSPST